MKLAAVSLSLFAALIIIGCVEVRAESVTAQLNLVTAEGIGQAVGRVTFTDTDQGLRIETKFENLPPGVHGFHIHENGVCTPMAKDGHMTAAQAAGGHYDPEKTGRHLGPGGGGHKGDLPRLSVNEDGTANETLLVKGLSAGEIKSRAVIIHAGGDNYSDVPEELGGGGARVACGVIH